MLALGVAGSASSGLGGGGFALYYSARDHRVSFLDFRERAPAAATADMLTHTAATAAETPGESLAAVTVNPHDGGAATAWGRANSTRPAGASVGVPGEPRGIEVLLQRFGVLPRSVVVEPALRLAERGFVPSVYMAGLSQHFADTLRRDSLGVTWLSPGADGFLAGGVLTNPALARTLRTFAAHGAEDFYTGKIARDIVATDARIGGGLTLNDLRDYTVTDRAALAGEHYGYRWVTAPPESAGGYTLLASLGLLSSWLPDDSARRASDIDLLHAMVESWQGPLVDRARYFTDPDFTYVPVEALLDVSRINTRAAWFDRAHARGTMRWDLPLRGTQAGSAEGASRESGTSHLCVVDAEGNVASVTTTVNIPWGAGTSVDGFWLNDQMDDFTTQGQQPGNRNAGELPPGEANLPGPWHRPVSSMTPTIVFEGDQPVLCVGGSGGAYIITAVVQAAYRALVLNQDVGEAIAHPRIHHPPTPDMVMVEDRVPREVIAGLVARGHVVGPMQYGAMVQMIRIRRTPTGVILEAGSDPRKGGRPAGN